MNEFIQIVSEGLGPLLLPAFAAGVVVFCTIKNLLKKEKLDKGTITVDPATQDRSTNTNQMEGIKSEGEQQFVTQGSFPL